MTRETLTPNERAAYDALLNAPSWLRDCGVCARQVLIYGDRSTRHMTPEAIGRALSSLVRKGWAVRRTDGQYTAGPFA